MAVHHGKHHAAYVANYNVAADKLKTAIEKNDFKTIVSLGPALKFNAGGHINHTIFWETLSANGGKPSSELLDAICRDFGTFDNMKTVLANTSVGIQGSGWGWLGYNKTTKTLQIAACANQDPLQETTGEVFELS